MITYSNSINTTEMPFNKTPPQLTFSSSRDKNAFMSKVNVEKPGSDYLVKNLRVRCDGGWHKKVGTNRTDNANPLKQTTVETNVGMSTRPDKRMKL